MSCRFRKLNMFMVFALLLFLMPFISGCVNGLQKKAPVNATVRNQGDPANKAGLSPYGRSQVNHGNTLKNPIKGEQDRNGSLWRDSGPLSELFFNPKARRVGDIVTIKIIEVASASNNASTDTGRDTSWTAGIDNLFGLENSGKTISLGKNIGRLNPFGDLKVSAEKSFAGTGATKRSNDLTAYISATVTDAMQNGNLKIMGTREVTVNGEKQIITLTGIIRSRDITQDNEILSTYIANARIFYTGSGVIDEVQRPGWLARVVDVVWPF